MLYRKPSRFSSPFLEAFFRGRSKEDIITLPFKRSSKLKTKGSTFTFQDEDEDEYDNEESDSDEEYISASNEEDEGDEPTMFIWRTAGDGNVRPEHAERDGQEFEVDGPEWEELGKNNCRCEAEIITDDEEFAEEKFEEKEKEEKDNERRKMQTQANKKQNERKVEKIDEEAKNKKIDIATDTARKNAEEIMKTSPHGKGLCAQKSREAIESTGVKVGVPEYGKDYTHDDRIAHAVDYPPKLKDSGFDTVAKTNKNNPAKENGYPDGYIPQKGDVMVMKPNGKDMETLKDGTKRAKPYGHMAIYWGKEDGKDKWISDFVQDDIFANNNYRETKPDTLFFRHPTWSKADNK